MKMNRITGTAVPLSALKTEKCPVVGEFSALKELSAFAKKCNLEIIQLLPVNDSGTQSSPYSALSAFALHPLYICLSEAKGFSSLYEKDEEFKKLHDSFVKKNKNALRWNYEKVLDWKLQLLSKIFAVFMKENKKTLEKSTLPEELSDFFEKNAFWIKSYASFKVLKAKYLQSAWKDWKRDDKNPDDKKIDSVFTDSLANENPYLNAAFYVWMQKIAFSQFESAVSVLKKEKIILKGDLPILLNEDSCDVWEKRNLFNYKKDLPETTAGSPPDGENPTGQNWGFPTYAWDQHEKDDFAWWKNRLKVAENFYGAYRLDHVLGFFRIWAVPYGEKTAALGHTEPFSPIKKSSLEKIGFSKERIKWLSLPHIPTLCEAKTMEIFCTRVNNEELWNFKEEIKTDSDIEKAAFAHAMEMESRAAGKKVENEKVCLPDSLKNLVAELEKWNKNRTLIEIKKDNFVLNWKFGETQGWNSLNEEEKSEILELFDAASKKQEKLWENQADKILKALTSSTKMIPCAEDLGAPIQCMPKILEKNNILSLLVVRWCRNWGENGQPYVSLQEYKENAVCTTSVHDSSTMRQWFESEKLGGESLPLAPTSLVATPSNGGAAPVTPPKKAAEKPFVSSPKLAFELHKKIAKTSSAFLINPLQDFLYLEKKYWSEDCESERINVPGSVTEFNWTYRIPANLEKLVADEKLQEKIRTISCEHKKSQTEK